jgi:hypothetical protein
MTPIYGAQGDVVGWLDTPDCIRDLNGATIGWLYEDAVHGVRGQHVGYFNDGAFRDHSGEVVAWVDGATGTPLKPIQHIRPVQPVKHVNPVRAVREVKHVRAVRSISWSASSILEYLPKD